VAHHRRLARSPQLDAPLYRRWADVAAIRERLDPEGRFVNAWIERALL